MTRKPQRRETPAVEFKPIDVRGKEIADALQAIADGVNKTHECVHRLREDQEHVNGDINRSVGALVAKFDMMDGRVSTISKAMGVEKVEPGEKRPRGHAVATWGRWKLLSYAGGAITLAVFVYQLAAAILPPAFLALHSFLMSR